MNKHLELWLVHLWSPTGRILKLYKLLVIEEDYQV
jgi:hypothetical protein